MFKDTDVPAVTESTTGKNLNVPLIWPHPTPGAVIV